MLGFQKCQFPSQESNNYLLLGTGTSSTTCHELGQRQLPCKNHSFPIGKVQICNNVSLRWSGAFRKMSPLRCCNRSCVQVGGLGAAGGALAATESN